MRGCKLRQIKLSLSFILALSSITTTVYCRWYVAGYGKSNKRADCRRWQSNSSLDDDDDDERQGGHSRRAMTREGGREGEGVAERDNSMVTNGVWTEFSSVKKTKPLENLDKLEWKASVRQRWIIIDDYRHVVLPVTAEDLSDGDKEQRLVSNWSSARRSLLDTHCKWNTYQ